MRSASSLSRPHVPRGLASVAAPSRSVLTTSGGTTALTEHLVGLSEGQSVSTASSMRSSRAPSAGCTITSSYRRTIDDEPAGDAVEAVVRRWRRPQYSRRVHGLTLEIAGLRSMVLDHDRKLGGEGVMGYALNVMKLVAWPLVRSGASRAPARLSYGLACRLLARHPARGLTVPLSRIIATRCRVTCARSAGEPHAQQPVLLMLAAWWSRDLRTRQSKRRSRNTRSICSVAAATSSRLPVSAAKSRNGTA